MFIIHRRGLHMAFVEAFYLEMPILIKVFPNVRLSFMKLERRGEKEMTYLLRAFCEMCEIKVCSSQPVNSTLSWRSIFAPVSLHSAVTEKIGRH